MSEFEKWWNNIHKNSYLVPANPDYASAELAWNHQQARIDELETLVASFAAVDKERVLENQRLREAAQYVYEDLKLRAENGVVAIGRGAWIKLCKALEVKGDEST